MPGLINLDFADVRAIMKDAGSALMGIGRASGENRAVEAARQAIASPLLEVDIAGAQGILFNITGSSSLSLYEVTEAAEEIRAAADPEANIIFGTSFNERLGDEVMITVIATGFDGGKKRQIARADAAAGVMDSSAAGRPSRERDFLEELQRQRDEVADGGAFPTSRRTRTRRPRWSPCPGSSGRSARPRPPSDRPRPTTPTTSRSRASFAGSDPRRRDAGELTVSESGPPHRARIAPPASGSSSGSPTPARGPVATRRGDPASRSRRPSPADALRDAVAAGLDLLGENRVQEAAAKAAEVPGARWHLVGPLQSNKARRALEVFDVDPVGRLGRAGASGSTGWSGEVRPGDALPGPAPGQRRRRPGQGGLRARRAGGGRSTAIGGARRARRPRPDDDRPAGRRDPRTPGRRSASLRELSERLRGAGAPDRARPVDGHDRRLRARGRGGRDDRPRRPGPVRGARPRPRPRSRRGPRPLTAGRPRDRLVDSAAWRSSSTSSSSCSSRCGRSSSAGCVMSWVDPAGRNRVSAFLFQATEPLLAPGPAARCRRPGTIDWSGFVVVIVLFLLWRAF